MSGIVNNWERQTNTSTEYYIEASNNETKNYNSAARACSEMKAILASIKSLTTQLFLETLIPRQPSENQTRFYWTGGHKTTAENTWRWQDNTTLNYTNWRNGEGLNNSTEQCVSVFSVGNFDWFDSNCETESFGYVCQREVQENIPLTVIPDNVLLETTMIATIPVMGQTTPTMATTAIPQQASSISVNQTDLALLTPIPSMSILAVIIPLIAIFLLCITTIIIVAYRRRYGKWSTPALLKLRFLNHSPTTHTNDNTQYDIEQSISSKKDNHIDGQQASKDGTNANTA